MAAVIYQSSQTNTGTDSTSIVVTKPTSLAVGDLMVGICAAYVSGAGVTPTTISGWTSAISGTNTGSNGKYNVMWKIADSSDVAASNFTFGTSGGTPDIIDAAISRLTSQDPTAPVDQSIAAQANNVSGITPTQAMGLYLMFAMGFNGGAGAGSYAGYTTANNNPTWTEAYDIGGTKGSTKGGIAMAYGLSSHPSASGLASATATSYTTTTLVFLNVIPAPLPTFTMTSSMATPSLRYSGATFSMTSTLNVPTYSEVAPTWTDGTRSTTTWTNQTRS